MTSNELRHEGKHTSKREAAGQDGQVSSGMGMGGEGMSAEYRRLADERPYGEQGTKTEAGRDTTNEGSESLPVVRDSELAGERK
jgi:hypothetical protein